MVDTRDEQQDPAVRLASLECERRALLALCLNYDRLLDSVVTSRRWRYGNAIGSLAGRLPQPVRALGLGVGRKIATSKTIRSWLSLPRPDAEYSTLRNRLFSLAFPDTAPIASLSHDDLSQAELAVTVVAVLYNNEATVAEFLLAMNAQTYQDQIEIVLVDDFSSDTGVARAEETIRQMGSGCRISLKLLRNATNLGNCPSRNAGIRAATGDILFVIDADCIVNEDFVAAHIAEHRRGFGVAIGPMGIESNGRDINELISSLVGSREETAKSMRLQDATSLTSAVNCVTRNFSVTRQAVKLLGRDLFDERFTYRNAPDTGFGWEDVEMGASLRRSGATIAFTWNAISVHVSHAGSVNDRTKALGSARNFALLMSLHPELFFESRDWARYTFGRISAWLTRHGIEPAEILGDIATMLADEPTTDASNQNLVVYTAVAGGYDKALPAKPTDGVTYVRFSDSSVGAPGWQSRDFTQIASDPVRTAKKPKVLPHLFLQEADWSIWMDGNIQLIAHPSEVIAEVAASGCHIGVFRHPDRSCIYEEAIQCIRRKKDEPDLIIEQMQRYRNSHYPQKNGLAECNVIVRQHNVPAVVAAMKLWWAEIEGGSRRDQLSFNYALWRSGLHYHELSGGSLNVRTDARFRYLPHANA